MSLRLCKTATAGLLVAGLGISFAYAAADDAIKGRQSCMKAHGESVYKLMGPIMKGEKPYDAAAIQAAMDNEVKACAGWTGWWGEDSQKGETAETWAKPEIWSDKAGFEAAGGAWYQAYQTVKATTDEAGFRATFPALAKACQNCHDKFRRPKEP